MGFLKDHSTEFAAMELTDKVLKDIDEKHITLAIFMDLIKADWLAVNKLSLNIRKTKYVIFHAINKRIEGVIPDFEIDGIPLDRVKNFNLLGLQLNENMSWKPHIDSLSNKLAKCAGVLNRLKSVLPAPILRTLYFSMVQSGMMYCLLTRGFYYYRLEKLQKRFVRMISFSENNAHCEPLFTALDTSI